MTNVVIEVRGGDAVAAYKKLQRECAKIGLLREMRVHNYHVKPSLKRRLKSLRARKAERKRVSQRVVRRDGNGDPII